MAATTYGYDLPTSEQIAKAAYERWEGRGYSHGSDREDWLAAERELTFRLNYQPIVREVLGFSALPPINQGAKRRCRFCELATPQAIFSAQHRSVNDGFLESFVSARTDVCDECVQGFRESLEPELSEFWSSLPSRLGNGPTETGPSLGVFKALTWMALALMPERHLELFPDALEWVSNPDHEVDASLFDTLQGLAYRLPGLDRQNWVSLEQKRDEDSVLPGFLFFVASGPFILQSAVPLGILDQELDDTPKLLGRWWTPPDRSDLGVCRLFTPARAKRTPRSRLGA